MFTPYVEEGYFANLRSNQKFEKIVIEMPKIGKMSTSVQIRGRDNPSSKLGR